MDNGWIKLHRRLLDSEIFASQIGLKIWLWCLIKASHKRRFIPIKIGKGETTVAVAKGSFIFGRHSAEKELNINGSTVYKWIHKLQDVGMIKIESNNQYSIITICNYENYQRVDDDEVTATQQPRNSHVTATQQPRNTYKNVKNDKNVENDIPSNLPFYDFWDLYDKKVGSKKKLEKKWEKISEEDRTKIREYIPRYKKSQPDKMFRKNPETFLNNESWNDEIINESKNINYGKDRRDSETANREQQIMQLAREAGMA